MAANVAAQQRKVVSKAFALGGLGANNLHGLGVLHAAIRRNIVPDMISCTSGQIHAVWKYLHAKENIPSGHSSSARDLEDFAKVYADEVEIKPKLPFPEIANDIPDLVNASIKHLSDVESFRANPFGYFMNITLNNMPARMLVPVIKGNVLEEMTRDFNNETKTGIAFNSYNPSEGREYVYLNPLAADLINRSLPSVSSFRKTAYHTTEYKPITPESILDALWLYEYGLEGHDFVDGSYFRQIMLSELSRAETIFVARPIQWNWKGPMPVTYGDREIFKNVVFFNAAYYGERFRIELINRLLNEGALEQAIVEREGYHKVVFYEIEATTEPFVGYFSESMQMFYEAQEAAEKVFGEALAQGFRK